MPRSATGLEVNTVGAQLGPLGLDQTTVTAMRQKDLNKEAVSAGVRVEIWIIMQKKERTSGASLEHVTHPSVQRLEGQMEEV